MSRNKKNSTAVLEIIPLLAIEIVSLQNSQDDYLYKRSDCAVIKIPKYWMIDPFQ